MRLRTVAITAATSLVMIITTTGEAASGTERLGKPLHRP